MPVASGVGAAACRFASLPDDPGGVNEKLKFGLQVSSLPAGRLQTARNCSWLGIRVSVIGLVGSPPKPIPLLPSNGSTASDLHWPGASVETRRLSTKTAESRM